MKYDAFPAEWMEKHSHVLTSLLCVTRGSGLEKEREPIADHTQKEGIVQLCVFTPWSKCVHVSDRSNE